MSENHGRPGEPTRGHVHENDETHREVSDAGLQENDDSKVGDKLMDGETPKEAAEAKAAGEEAKQRLP